MGAHTRPYEPRAPRLQGTRHRGGIQVLQIHFPARPLRLLLAALPAMTQLHMATHGTRALPGPLPARPRPCQAARLPPAACLRCAGAGASGTQQRLVGREGRRRRLCATQMPQQQEAATEESAVAGRAEAGGNEPEQSFGVRYVLGRATRLSCRPGHSSRLAHGSATVLTLPRWCLQGGPGAAVLLQERHFALAAALVPLPAHLLSVSGPAAPPLNGAQNGWAHSTKGAGLVWTA